MDRNIPLKELAKDIELIYSSDSSKAESLIEGYLEQQLKELSAEDRLTFLDNIANQFKGTKEPEASALPQEPRDSDINSEMISKLYSLLLGKGVSEADLSSEDTLEKLAAALNTIFDKLNELVGVIHSSFLGRGPEVETIRHVIGSNLVETKNSSSIEDYLDQIKKAFLIAHDAFKKSAKTKVQEIILELDPKRIATLTAAGLKFGPLRKAELFDVYQEKYDKVKKWFKSERFIEELLREFEKHYRKLYTGEKGGI